MVRRIIEDIRLNKKERKIPSMKEVILSPKLTAPPNDYKEREKEEIVKETEEKKELKIKSGEYRF